MTESHFSHLMKNKKQLIWVYPPNNWKSTSNKTFVYGWSDPKAKLFVSTEAGFKPAHTKIKIFPNGNFAQVVKLPKKENIIRLVQVFGKKETILKRKILVGADLCVCPNVKQDRHTGLPLRHKNDMTVVIDPGHGGKEHGTHSPKRIPEKVFNLQIAKLFVGAYCNTPLQGKIYLTRTTDKYVSLKDRVNFAKNKKCNILISIHHNALPDGEDPLKHRGVGIYYTHDFVKPFAKKLLFSISKSVGACRGMPLLKKYGIFKRNFALTRPDFCYAVLIECGFLTHPIEAEVVTQRKIQEKIVRGIAKATM